MAHSSVLSRDDYTIAHEVVPGNSALESGIQQIQVELEEDVGLHRLVRCEYSFELWRGMT